MTLSDLQSLIGQLTNDPNHDKYKTSSPDDIGIELDNVQDRWNLEAGILKDVVTLTVVDGTRNYALSALTGTPIRFDRVTHKGLLLERKDKSWYDLYKGGDDWSDNTGTPTGYYIDVSDPDNQNIFLYPIPQSADAGANLVVEYVKRHTSMSAAGDSPFNSNLLLTPYHHGLAYHASANLLLRDPSEANVLKVGQYNKLGNNILSKVIEVFKNQEREAPYRLRGGRRW